MTKAAAGLAVALSSLIALPDFSAREWPVQVDGQTKQIRYCIRAYSSPEAEVGTVLRFVGDCPRGWLHANGEYIARELYPDLYAVLESLAGGSHGPMSGTQ